MIASRSPFRELEQVPLLLRKGLKPGWRLIVAVSRALAEGVRPTMAWIGASIVVLALALAAQAAVASRLPEGFWYVAGALPLILFCADWYREMTRETRPRFDPLWNAWNAWTPAEETPVEKRPVITESVAASYRVLNLSPGTPRSEVKAAYRRLVKQWHPDRFAADPAAQERAAAKLRSIIRAYQQVQSPAAAPRTAPRTRAATPPVLDRSSWMFATAIVLVGFTTLYVVSIKVFGVCGFLFLVALM